jgi:hypothetical protein
MEAGLSSETSVDLYQTTPRFISDDSILDYILFLNSEKNVSISLLGETMCFLDLVLCWIIT